jgi:site-specific DNA-methyltransferase (adenine-specific)
MKKRSTCLIHKPSQDTTRKVYMFVPTQEWTRKETDEDLCTKNGISASEIAFIEKVVRPMDLSGSAEDD